MDLFLFLTSGSFLTDFILHVNVRCWAVSVTSRGSEVRDMHMGHVSGVTMSGEKPLAVCL